MAYAALVSLANTIFLIQNHNQFSIPLEAKHQIISLSEYVTSFQTFLEKFPDKFNSLEGRMRERALEAEDKIEYYLMEKVSSGFNVEYEYNPSRIHELQLEKVIDEIVLIAGEVKEIENSSSSKDVDQRGADSSPLSSSSPDAPPIRKEAMVGFEGYVEVLKERLCGEPSKLYVIPICGMGGIGKTTLAKHVYDDPLIVEYFDIRVWLTISQDYSTQRFFSSLLESLKELNRGRLGKTNEEKVRKILMGRRYLVVMDDIWNNEAWDVVRMVFPDNGNGSRIMLTTRLSDVASYPDPWSKLYEIHLMDADQSWDLLKKKVFEGDEVCPSELEKIGWKIARSCKGLPLAIVVIAGLLSTVSKNPASWQEIAENLKSAESPEKVQIEEILSLSYTNLPQYLAPCFLYMGSFPEDEEISVVKLIRLWIAEGLVKPPIDSDSFENVGEECLDELVKRNLVLVTRRKFDGRIKRCGLHDLMRDLCIRKAHESKLYLNLMEKHIEKESFVESMQNQRRVNVDSSDLMHLSSLNGSTIQSIKCSRHHLVKLDFLESVKLLRVLDTEPADVKYSPSMARLYELFHLRYLAIRYSHGVSRDSLWNLQNLQTLIIHEEKGFKFGVGVACNLELHWFMRQLRHVYFYGTIYLYDPEETACSLESLQTLSYVGHKCCTERILKKIPNLKKLKIDCSGGVHHGDATCLNDLVHLPRLENLEVYAGCWVHARPKSYEFTFPSMLKRLSLRDLRLAWNDLAMVGSLSNLQVLKLKNACVGRTWETMEGVFLRLEVLVVEALWLENWTTESSHFPCLKRLLLRSCWNLDGIPNDIGEIPTLELIEVKGDVRKCLVESAEEIQKEQEELGNITLQVLCIEARTARHKMFNYYEASDDDIDDSTMTDDDDDNIFTVINDEDIFAIHDD